MRISPGDETISLNGLRSTVRYLIGGCQSEAARLSTLAASAGKTDGSGITCSQMIGSRLIMKRELIDWVMVLDMDWMGVVIAFGMMDFIRGHPLSIDWRYVMCPASVRTIFECSQNCMMEIACQIRV